MCRLFAYVTPDSSAADRELGEAGIAAFQSLARLHGDGWGWAGIDRLGDAPDVRKSPRSAADDPEFPAMQEFEVDEGGPKANTRKHPGLIWAIIAIVAVIALCIAFAAAGDWMNPTQAEKVQQTEFEEQTVPEDLGPNENPEAA